MGPRQACRRPKTTGQSRVPTSGTPGAFAVLTGYNLALESKYTLDCVFAAVFPDEIELRQVDTVMQEQASRSWPSSSYVLAVVGID
jgi:hypothetical protein